MMSSEEEPDCFALYGDKLLKKAKRSRQRVDAGEPRNSYSSIPNFSSRPSFLNSTLYGAFLSQNQHLGLLGPGFTPAKMLNELLGRQVKQASDATCPGDGMMTMDPAAASEGAGVNFECGGPVIRRGLEDGSPPPGDVAHHMLRDILQGRKKDFLALEQEVLRGVAAGAGNTDPHSPDNNNSINNNNNNEVKLNTVLNGGDVNHVVDSNCTEGKSPLVNGLRDMDQMSGPEDGNGGDDGNFSDDGGINNGKSSSRITMNDDDMNVNNGNASDSEQSVVSPASDSVMKMIKEEPDMDGAAGGKDASERGAADRGKAEPNELKRARVENIVSSMRSSPSLPTPVVNGCKKRKWYHPQQHDTTAERYQSAVNMHMSLFMDDESADNNSLDNSEIRLKKVEKDHLKNQLRTMQEQLAEMQQKYVQLCTRMDQDSQECQNEDEGSDMEQDVDNNSMSLPDKPSKSPPPTPTPMVKDQGGPTMAPQVTTPPSQSSSLTPTSSKMMMMSSSNKLSAVPQMSAGPNPAMAIPPNFNGALSLLQQQVLQDQQQQQHPGLAGLHHGHHHPHHHHGVHHGLGGGPHHALSNAAAAMYLGASHKLFMEQEARMNKEAAIAAEQQQQHQQHLSQQATHHGPPLAQHPCPPTSQQQVPPPSGAPMPTTLSSHAQPTLTQTVQTSRMSPSSQQSAKNHEFTERLNMLRNSSLLPINGQDLEGLADILKNEISSSLGTLIDTIMARFVQQKRFASKQHHEAEQLNKELLLHQSQLADRKSPRTKVIDRGNSNGVDRPNVVLPNGMNGPVAPITPSRINGTVFPTMPPMPHHPSTVGGGGGGGGGSGGGGSGSVIPLGGGSGNGLEAASAMNMSHGASVRATMSSSMFQPPKPPSTSMSSASAAAAAAAASLYSSMTAAAGPFCLKSEPREGAPEQNEALSLVVHPQKKKRHKVTDTRITPRTVSRILAQDGGGLSSVSQPNSLEASPKYGGLPLPSSGGPSESPPPPPRPYHAPPPPPPMLPVSLPTSVAIPNPSLHESKVFSPYSPFYHHMPSSSPPGMSEMKRESSPISHPPSLLHPALLAAAAQQHGPPPADYNNLRSSHMSSSNDNVDRSSDCNSGDGPYDGITPTISSTLTPMHLRKAKLMFFWVRYPSSAVLKMYFPDIKFNKNNTAQLVKWFSNFREFYYIQMEKYARQAASEGAKACEDLHVSGDCEIYRVLNLHYNRNNHIEVPQNFRYVVEQTLKEFFKAIQGGKDTEQSWKKSIYKIISRLDDPVPEYFKSPNFLEQLE